MIAYKINQDANFSAFYLFNLTQNTVPYFIGVVSFSLFSQNDRPCGKSVHVTVQNVKCRQ